MSDSDLRVRELRQAAYSGLLVLPNILKQRVFVHLYRIPLRLKTRYHFVEEKWSRSAGPTAHRRGIVVEV